jgi:hypothetical protein
MEQQLILAACPCDRAEALAIGIPTGTGIFPAFIVLGTRDPLAIPLKVAASWDV